jgi:quinoprotein glucose dehydrogenase
MNAGKFFIIAIFAIGCGRADTSSSISEWPTFGHDASNNKFSALTSIDTANVKQLREVWRNEDSVTGAGLYCNPVMMSNKLIGLMPSSLLVAMDPASGKALWQFKPDTSSIPNWSKGITGLPGATASPTSFF